MIADKDKVLGHRKARYRRRSKKISCPRLENVPSLWVFSSYQISGTDRVTNKREVSTNT